MTSLSNKASYLIVLNLIKYAVGFIVPIVAARLLTKDDYGTYQQILLLANTSVGIMVLGIPMSIYYFYNLSEKNKDRKLLVTQSFVILNISALICVTFLYLLRENIANALNNDALVDYIPVLLPYIYCYISSEYFFHLLISKDKYKKSIVYGVSESVARSLLVITAAFVFADVLYLVSAISLYAFARYMYCVLSSDTEFSSIGALRKHSYFKNHLAYSMPLAFTALVGLLGRLMDKFFITANFSTTQFANYTVGSIELPLDVIFQRSVANVLRTKLPSLVRDNNYGEISKLINESTRKLSLIIIPVFVFLMVYAKEFIVILFTEKYIESVIIFKIYLMLIPLHIFILSAVPQCFGLTGIGLKISSFTLVINFILSLVLLEYVGFVGPAISTVLSMYIGTTIYLIVVSRLINFRISQFVPVLEILKITSLCVAVIVPISYFYSIDNIFIEFLLSGSSYVLVFVCASWYLGILNPYDKKLIRNLWLIRKWNN